VKSAQGLRWSCVCLHAEPTRNPRRVRGCRECGPRSARTVPQAPPRCHVDGPADAELEPYLAVAIRTLGDALASGGTAPKPPEFSVAVEGETRDLHPIVRDEIYKIAAEALRNAFQHASAGRVEVEIRYDDEQFRLRVRDDGKGIDPKVLADQRLDGHYGLRGMPERAGLIGGKLAMWSEVDTGTEVEFRLPAGMIYAPSARRSWWQRISASKTSVHEGHDS
jgi:hypothetical protein